MKEVFSLRRAAFGAVLGSVLTLVPLVAVPGFAGAADRPSPAGGLSAGMTYDDFLRDTAMKIMRERDGNRDGALSRAEAEAFERTVPPDRARIDLGDVDADGDGRVSQGELEAALRRNPELRRRFDALDADRDGVLSEQEWNGGRYPGAVSIAPQIRLKF